MEYAIVDVRSCWRGNPNMTASLHQAHIQKRLITRSLSAVCADGLSFKDCVAGSTGLEPVLYATKKRCITIMLRPN